MKSLTDANVWAFNFYADLINSLSNDQIDGAQLKIMIYDDFLEEILIDQNSTDLSAIMTEIVENYFNETVEAAIEYSNSQDPQFLLPIL